MSKRVDPVTGLPSNRKNAITYSRWLRNFRVDPKLGKSSNRKNAITKGKWYNKKRYNKAKHKSENVKSKNRVDPKTGKSSNKPNAIPVSTWRNRRKVDPVTGEYSNKINAISYARWYDSKKVDPITGKLSNKPDAITRSAFRSRKHNAKRGKKRNNSIKRKRDSADNIEIEKIEDNNVIKYTAVLSRYRRKNTNNSNNSYESNSDDSKRRRIFITLINENSDLEELCSSDDGESSSTDTTEIIDYDLYQLYYDGINSINSDNDNKIVNDGIDKSDNETISYNLKDIMSNILTGESVGHYSYNHDTIQLNNEELDNVINTIRDITTDSINIVYKLVKYFRSGIKPTEIPVNNILNIRISKTPVFFSKDFQIKQEQKTYSSYLSEKIEMVSSSIIDRNSLLGAYAPVGKFYREMGNVIDLTEPPGENYDWYEQKSVYYKDLNQQLKLEAENDRSFGMVTLCKCNEYTTIYYLIFYIATKDDVKYIDINRSKEKYIYNSIEDIFPFVDHNMGSDVNVFGTKVFYTPLNN